MHTGGEMSTSYHPFCFRKMYCIILSCRLISNVSNRCNHQTTQLKYNPVDGNSCWAAVHLLTQQQWIVICSVMKQQLCAIDSDIDTSTSLLIHHQSLSASWHTSINEMALLQNCTTCDNRTANWKAGGCWLSFLRHLDSNPQINVIGRSGTFHIYQTQPPSCLKEANSPTEATLDLYFLAGQIFLLSSIILAVPPVGEQNIDTCGWKYERWCLPWYTFSGDGTNYG